MTDNVPVIPHSFPNVDELKPCHFRQVDPHGRILCNVIKGGDREVSVQLCRACPVSQINCQHLRAGLEKQVSTPITVRFATGRVEVWDDAPPAITFKQAACAAKTMPIHSPRDCAGCPIRMPNVVPVNAIQVAHRNKPGAVAEPVVMAAQARPAQRTTRAGQRVASPAVPAAARAGVQPTALASATEQPNAVNTALSTSRAKAAVARPETEHATSQAPAAVDMGMAADLLARARATAERKAKEKEQREMERLAREQQAQASAPPEPKPKIIQIQEWLAGQANKRQNTAKANSPYKPQAVQADADGVSDIVYAPLGAQTAMAYQETIDYERCVGWTD